KSERMTKPECQMERSNPRRVHSGFGYSCFFRHFSLVIRHSDFRHCIAVNVERAFAKTNEDDLLHRTVPLKKFLHLASGNSRPFVQGKTISAGADRRKSNRARALLFRQGEGIAITTRQQFLLAMPAIAPDRTDRVNHPLGRELVAFGDFRLAGRTAAE